jgi:uncharacterized protein YkwD
MPPALLALLLGGLAALAGGLSSGRSTRTEDDDTATIDDDPDAPDAVGTPDTSTPGPDPHTFPDLPDTAYGLDWAGLTAEEQLIVELVNRARMDPAAEVARLGEPLASGIPGTPAQPLAVTRSLSLASREHSEDMDDRDFFAHTNPDGQSPGARAIEEGHGSGFVGENIGWIGSTSTSFDGQTRTEAHHQNLWDSDGHQRNLMDARWSEIGVGYDSGSYQGYNGSTFVTEMFGDRGHSYLTGVAIEDGDGDDFYDIGEGLGGVRITAWDGTSTFGTETWAAGGYSLRLAAGTYDVLFEGGGLDRAVTRTVTIGGDNVKLDVVEDDGTVAFASRLSEPAPQAGAVLAGLPVIPMESQPLPVEEEEEDALLWA